MTMYKHRVDGLSLLNMRIIDANHHKVQKKTRLSPAPWKIKKTIPPWVFLSNYNDCLTNHKVGVSNVKEIKYIA